MNVYNILKKLTSIIKKMKMIPTIPKVSYDSTRSVSTNLSITTIIISIPKKNKSSKAFKILKVFV